MALLTLLAADGHSVTVDQAPKAEAAKSVRLVGAEQWVVFETSFTSVRKYDNPFLDVQVDVVFSQGDTEVGCSRFPGRPVPYSLIARIVKFRIKENVARRASPPRRRRSAGVRPKEKT